MSTTISQLLLTKLTDKRDKTEMRRKQSKRVTDRKQKRHQNVTSEAKSRAKFLCPKPLEKLIELVNSVPPERDLPPLQEIFDQTGVTWDTHWTERYPAIVIINEKLAGVPDSFFEDIQAPDDSSYLILKYDKFTLVRRVVRELARLAPLGLHERRGRFYQLKNQGDWIWPTSQIYIDRHSGVITERKDLLSALVGVEAQRVRECEVCRRIFWAQREDRWTHSKKCSDTQRQRRLRDPEQRIEYERRRAERERRAAQKSRSNKRQK
jgi:hypothetical protein